MKEEKRDLKEESTVEKNKNVHNEESRKFLLLILAVLLLFIILFRISGEVSTIVKHETDKMGNPAEKAGGYIDSLAGRKGVCFDNLLIMGHLMLYDEMSKDICLCIFNTGDIYSFEYYKKDGWANRRSGYEQQGQGYDDGIWENAENVFYLGRLPKEEAVLLNEYVDDFDIESERYSWRSQYGGYGHVNDEIRIFQFIYIYWHEQPEKYGTKDTLIEASGLNCEQNDRYEKERYIYSIEENADAIIALLESSPFYDRWIEMYLNGETAK